MTHPNAQILKTMYDAFGRGDIATMLSLCADHVTFQVAGKSKLAGKYTKENFASGYLTKVMDMSDNTLKVEIHDILASDRHGTVLCTDTLTCKGEQIQIRTVHVWRIENGKPVAWYEYPRDLYQYDAIWS